MLAIDYSLGVGALLVALFIAIIDRKLVRQAKIDKIIKRIRERAEDSGNESEGDIEELSTMVDMGHLRLMDIIN
uniref:Protein Vpu n=1 Tax=Human immunodeficiency virus type 1 TaxID=11676 RepID=Q8UT74_HV1|nr:vpu protein [Human immunodeficiency virus 1]